MGTLLLSHKLTIARKQLLTVVIGNTISPCPTLKKLLVLSRHQVTVVAFGGQSGQFFRCWRRAIDYAQQSQTAK